MNRALFVSGLALVSAVATVGLLASPAEAHTPAFTTTCTTATLTATSYPAGTVLDITVDSVSVANEVLVTPSYASAPAVLTATFPGTGHIVVGSITSGGIAPYVQTVQTDVCSSTSPSVTPSSSVSVSTTPSVTPSGSWLRVPVILSEHVGERVLEFQHVPVELLFRVAVFFDKRLVDLERQRVSLEWVLHVCVSLREHVGQRVIEFERCPIELVCSVAVIQALHLGRGDVDHEVPEPVDFGFNGGRRPPPHRWVVGTRAGGDGAARRRGGADRADEPPPQVIASQAGHSVCCARPGFVLGGSAGVSRPRDRSLRRT